MFLFIVPSSILIEELKMKKIKIVQKNAKATEKEVKEGRVQKQGEQTKRSIETLKMPDKLVWAKLRFCPYWRAHICTVPPEMKSKGKGKLCVFFFGSKNL